MLPPVECKAPVMTEEEEVHEIICILTTEALHANENSPQYSSKCGKWLSRPCMSVLKVSLLICCLPLLPFFFFLIVHQKPLQASIQKLLPVSVPSYRPLSDADLPRLARYWEQFGNLKRALPTPLSSEGDGLERVRDKGKENVEYLGMDG